MSPSIVSVSSGQEVSFDAMLDALVEAKVVYLGEHHDRVADHEVQRAVLAGLHARDPSLALGLEMVPYTLQHALDAYVAGTIDEAAMLEGTQWARRWGFDFALYRPIVDFARLSNLPIVALNAPSEITRAIVQRGLEGLDDAERASLPELDLASAAHRAMIEEALREHPGVTEQGLERYYTVQVVWDETMGEGVARFLGREGAPARMVVLAGVMHVRAGLGIPARAARRGATPHAIVLPVSASELDETLRTQPPVADFLVVTPDAPTTADPSGGD